MTDKRRRAPGFSPISTPGLMRKGKRVEPGSGTRSDTSTTLHEDFNAMLQLVGREPPSVLSKPGELTSQAVHACMCMIVFARERV